MIEGLEPVALQELRVLCAPRHWSVEGHLDQLRSLTPVRGQLKAEHRGNVLIVDGELSTIVNLCCDRCLGQYNHQLRCSSSELIWLGQSPPTEEELQNSEDIAAMVCFLAGPGGRMISGQTLGIDGHTESLANWLDP